MPAPPGPQPARRLPVIPTLVVLAAVVTMLALGVWQLARKAEKEALIARYERVRSLSSDVPFPRTEAEVAAALYRHATVRCDQVLAMRTIPGRNLAGESGVAQVARCRLASGQEADIALGWAKSPSLYRWAGGEVGGFLGPGGREARLVAGIPAKGLQPLAPPDPSEMPNNHLAYAVQWFLFALTALVVYVLALRRRGRRA